MSDLVGQPHIGQESEYAFRLPEMVRIAFEIGCRSLPTPWSRFACVDPSPAARVAYCRSAGGRASGDLEAAVRSFEESAGRWNGFGVVWEEAMRSWVWVAALRRSD